MPICPLADRSSSVLRLAALVSLASFAGAQNPQSTPTSLESEVTERRAEYSVVQEQLRKLEEQQKTILQQQTTILRLMDEFQRRLNAGPAAVTQQSPPASQPNPVPTANAELNTPPAARDPSSTPVPAPPTAALQADDNHYRDGMIIWQTREDAKVPFLLKFNVNTQFRYLNTLNSEVTYADHLGVDREVHQRNDFTVNRSMFILGGYVFDERAKYSVTVWTSAGAASIVVAGNIGWQFNKAITLTGGYTGVPGSRSLVNTFPFFTGSDRSMADNFFRPGFTQGIWANGEPVKGLNYLVMIGNGLNTLNITAAKIDTHLMTSGSVWWEPLGPYGPPGKDRNMYDDYFASKKVRIRLGTAFTISREDRFSNIDQSNPENTSLYNSDGVLTFSTGAFAPGVTVNMATYKMWAADWGIKWNGLAVNGQYFMRWLSHFTADGPLPLKSTFDQGGEFSASYFVKPKKLMPYIRGSWVLGQFGNSYEYGAGVKWFYLRTDRLWVNAELFRVSKSPYTGTFTPYTAGMTGWVPMLQAYLAF